MEQGHLDQAARRRHKMRNSLHTWLLVAGSLVLLALTSYAIGGVTGVIWGLGAGVVLIAMSQRFSAGMILRMYKARLLSDDTYPDGMRLIRALAERAGLPRPPRLYYIPSRVMNAFAVGRPDDSAVCVTDGLVRGLTSRQLAGVLAHEISHIRNEDIKVMAVADAVSRITSAMSSVGIFLLFVNLPLTLMGGPPLPWLGIGMLIAAPTVSALLQLALSRSREYDADMDAAELTGDPEGLASALALLERRQGSMWEMMLPGQRLPDPSLLRTHPRTEERVARLMSLHKGYRPMPGTSSEYATHPPTTAVPTVPRPRYHVRGIGLWY